MNTQQQYGMGYNNSFVNMLKQRHLETHGQFLLPYLKPGMKILDCGCGPGSMTIDFARYISSGEVTGIDIEASQLEIARLDAKTLQVNNVTFKNANVLALPYPDNTFDLVFSQGLISHFTDPLAALLEQKRVVKPNGIIAARNGYHSGATYYPTNPQLKAATCFQVEPIRKNGGDPDLGIKLSELFHRANLSAIKHTIFCDIASATNPLSREKFLTFAEEIVVREYSKKLIQAGSITLEQLKLYQKAWLDFANSPYYFSYFPWGEAIGIKP